MVKRLIDVVVASAALLVLSPLFLLAAVGIRLSSPGPVLFRAKRVGRNGTVFEMYKFRTMTAGRAPLASTITAKHDPRVFPFGVWLRRCKIDELPQLFNILKADMAVVGPRPEDPTIVDTYYAPVHIETLSVLPGLASPGSLYNFTHGEHRLAAEDPERCYVERLLPTKLALDTVYVREASLLYDLTIVVRTLWTIACIAVGRTTFPDPPEMRKAAGLIAPAVSGRDSTRPSAS